MIARPRHLAWPCPRVVSAPLAPEGTAHAPAHPGRALCASAVQPCRPAQLMPLRSLHSQLPPTSISAGTLPSLVSRTARRLRPAGLRPASRRLSRMSSAPERTKPFFSEPKGGEERSSFRGRMTRLSRKRLAGHRPPSPFPLRYSILGGHDSERHFGLNSRLPRLFQPLTSASLPRSHRPPANSPPRRGAHSALRRPTQHGFAVSGASRQVQRGPEDQA